MTIVPGKGSGATITSVESGQIDFGYVAPSTLAQSIAQDPSTDVEVVATIMQHAPWIAAYIKGRGISTPADLAGKAWGSNPGNPITQFYKGYMKAAGYALGPYINVESQQLLFAGKIGVLPDTVTIYPEIAANAANAGLEAAYFPLNTDKSLDYVNWSLVTKKSFAEKNPALVRAVVAAVLEGWYDTYTNPDAAVSAYAAQFSKLDDPKIVRALVDVSLPLAVSPAVCQHGLGWGDPATWDQSAQIFANYLGVSPEPTAQQLYTNMYLPQTPFIPPTC